MHKYNNILNITTNKTKKCYITHDLHKVHIIHTYTHIFSYVRYDMVCYLFIIIEKFTSYNL